MNTSNLDFLNAWIQVQDSLKGHSLIVRSSATQNSTFFHNGTLPVHSVMLACANATYKYYIVLHTCTCMFMLSKSKELQIV